MDNSARFLQLVHEIGGLVGSTAQSSSALAKIAERIGKTLKFDVVSIYVWRSADSFLELAASQGLDLPEDYKVTLGADEGLTGMVFTTGATQVIAPASEHPRYKYFPELGEENFEVFLGTPISLGGKRYGVLVAQSTTRRAIEPAEEKLFEILADRLAAALEVSQVLSHIPAGAGKPTNLEMYQGRGVSRGLAVGPVFVINDGLNGKKAANTEESIDTDAEVARLRDAFARVETQLTELAQQFETEFSAEVATADVDILRTQTYLMNDTAFRGEIESLTEQGGIRAEIAVQEVADKVSKRFSELEDHYFRERADDIYDIADRLISELGGDDMFGSPPQAGSVLIARRMGPAQLAAFARADIAGIVTEEGGANSHAAILARSLGIPAVTGARGVLARASTAAQVLMDGRSGFVFLDPSDELVSEYAAAESQQNSAIIFPELTAEQASRCSVYKLMANISIPADVSIAQAAGLDTVGLFRTELAFLHRSRSPTLMEQTAVYREIASNFSGTVTIRTMDFGGDKVPVYLPFPDEENPLLGLRSIRHSMQNLDLLRGQLRAVALTAKDHPNVRVLLPMITQIWELETARDLLIQAATEVGLTEKQIPKIGVMLETPSLIFQLDQFHPLADFVSIGTNDFVQYLIAVDRYSESVGHLYSELHPGVIRALNYVIEQASQIDLTISVCGEMASQPRGALALAALGYRDLSLMPATAPAIRYTLGSIGSDRLNAIRKGILNANRTSEVRAILSACLDEIDPRLSAL